MSCRRKPLVLLYDLTPDFFSAGLRCIELSKHETLFWRYQRGKPKTYLATIEAIYYFLVEVYRATYTDIPYQGQYDNLLFFFKFMYEKIHSQYDTDLLKAYKDI